MGRADGDPVNGLAVVAGRLAHRARDGLQAVLAASARHLRPRPKATETYHKQTVVMKHQHSAPMS